MSMFDALKSLGNPMDLMRKAREMQETMQRVQEDLARETVTADAGAGMVTATVNGNTVQRRIAIESANGIVGFG